MKGDKELKLLGPEVYSSLAEAEKAQELTDLGINIKIAELRGAKETFINFAESTVTAVFDNRTCFGYDALDNAPNLELRDEYEVTICYVTNQVYIVKFPTGICHNQEFTDKSQINRCVLICILESVK